MKNLPIITTVLACLIFLVSCGKKEMQVSGEIFIATKDGTIVKLGATPVHLVRKPKADGYGSRLQYFLENADYTTVSNSEGKFSFKVPADEYVLAAKASRDVFGKTEDYWWSVPVKPTAEAVTISLNNQNLVYE